MRILVACVVVVMASACAAKRDGAGGTASTWGTTPSCVDRDRDGFGEHCPAGPDCDDSNPTVHSGCLHCATPSEGCACNRATRPTACYLDQTSDPSGTVMCHEGTRYCRNGVWSGCESVFSFPAPAATQQAALVDPDAGPVHCNDCNVQCFRITDTLDPVDGGLTSSDSTNVTWVDGGGITLAPNPDAGTPDAGPVTSTVSGNPPCPGTPPDVNCDGIPDVYQPNRKKRPKSWTNPAIFLTLTPGQTGVGVVALRFALNYADVHFLTDASGSTSAVVSELQQNLTNGSFLNSSYTCVDTDGDGLPNNELRDQGILGAINCDIRDVNFGLGYFREIPFPNYASDDYVAFGNYQDITADKSLVQAASYRLLNLDNLDWPEASMVGLYSVLTGDGMYFGTTKRVVPGRADCPAGTFGYPCFRSDALPVVLLFTDAEFHNGPDTNAYPYDPASFANTASTDGTSHALANSNESFYSAANLGDLTSAYETFTGDTSAMTADVAASIVGSSCISSDAGNDAVFKFDLTQQKTVTIESTGSQFNTVLGLYTGIPGAPTDLPMSSNTNEQGASALDLGEAHGNYVRVSGDTSGMAADYQYSNLGSCGAATASPDAVFKFSVASTTALAIDTTNSAFDTVVGLYGGSPALPPTPTAVPNANDTYNSAYAIGDVYNHSLAFSGNTSASGLHADYSDAQLGCGSDGSANDVTYSFSLSNPTRVRLTTEGSSFNTVLGLFDNGNNPLNTATVGTTNETSGTAYNVGTLDGRIFNLSGSTSGMAPNYRNAQIGCNAGDASPDAVFKFHLNSAKDVQVDTSGTSWNTVLALFNTSNFDTATYLTATNTNEIYTSATDLGTVNGADISVTGATTASMAGTYDTSIVSCTSATTSPDAVYRFALSSATTVRVDLDGSAFDTVLSLHSGGLAATEITTALSSNTNDTQTTAKVVGVVNNNSLVFTGNDGTLAHNYNVACGSDGYGKDAVFQFTLSAATQVQVDTIGASFDTTLGIYPSTITPLPDPTSVSNTNKTFASAYDVGPLDGKYNSFSGTTVGANDDTDDANCSANKGSEDAFFTFSLSATKNVIIKSSSTDFTPTIQLFKWNGTAWAYQSCNASLISTSLASGSYAIEIKGTSGSAAGVYTLVVQDAAATAPTSNQVACDDDAGPNQTSKIVTNLAAGTYNVVVTSHSSTDSGAYNLRIRDVTWWNSNTSTQVACNDDITAGVDKSSKIEAALAAGTYWFVVKGYGATDKGNYALRVLDVSHPPTGSVALTCDDDGAGGTQSKIVRTSLAAGDYWAVLKGHTGSDAGAYKLNIQDLAATASGTRLACDDDTGESPQSRIETDLAAGTYQVVLKGKTASDQGAYRLQLRDVTKQPYDILACDDNGSTNNTSHLEQTLNAGAYYLALKGKTASSRGAYNLSIRDMIARPLGSDACDDDGSTYHTSKLTRTLDPGTYYVTLKGKDASQKGPYMLSVGGSPAVASTYTPPDWTKTLSVIESTGARVIPVLSCTSGSTHDGGSTAQNCSNVSSQALSLANASSALGKNLTPLVVDDGNKSFTGDLISAVSDLAHNIEMDATVNVLFDPDPNPGFTVSISPINKPGNNCKGTVGGKQQGCKWGSTMGFEIDFTNPADAPVPPNPNDPQGGGGYNFTAIILADGRFVIDRVPIYVVPVAPMAPPPPTTTYYTTGTYWQDIVANGCTGNQAPDWHDLSWVGETYGNTSITFSACTATSSAGLSTCTPHTIVRIAGGGTCATDADCPLGFCDTGISVCQIPTAGACATSADCPANAVCDMASLQCIFTSQPVYVGGALGADNFNPYMRVRIDLAGTPPFASPPVMQSWNLTYLCNNAL